MEKEHPYCPTCGQPTTFRTSPEWLLGHWNGKFVGMLAALIESRRQRRGLSMDEMVRAAYLNHKAPMPASPIGSIRVLLTTNRKKLKKLGWEILGPSVTKNGFWLVPVEDA
jgi:hypothetical protein